MGRLFDAVAALIGGRQVVTYEAQAAIEMEALCDADLTPAGAGYQFEIDSDGSGGWIFDAAPIIAAIAADLRAGLPARMMAARFHGAVADLIAALAIAVRGQTGLMRVALSGGVFQNVTLIRMVEERLAAEGFVVCIHRLVPANDGGLALGQAAIAATRAAASIR
jgi:hydrogenase maturation protein HypF